MMFNLACFFFALRYKYTRIPEAEGITGAVFATVVLVYIREDFRVDFVVGFEVGFGVDFIRGVADTMTGSLSQDFYGLPTRLP